VPEPTAPSRAPFKKVITLFTKNIAVFAQKITLIIKDISIFTNDYMVLAEGPIVFTNDMIFTKNIIVLKMILLYLQRT
jgi:uncharacterized sodium:solute symporter family permease YidK